MRTWSVSGTAFALCTRSSSLSIRTRTSMIFSLLLVGQGSATSTVREHLFQAAGDGLWHELFDISAEGCNLLHPTRRDETHLRARHHVDGLDVRCEVTVQLVHLELPLEVRDDAQALHDRPRVPAAREVDDELAEDVDLDVLDEAVERLFEEIDALGNREHRL